MLARKLLFALTVLGTPCLGCGGVLAPAGSESHARAPTREPSSIPTPTPPLLDEVEVRGRQVRCSATDTTLELPSEHQARRVSASEVRVEAPHQHAVLIVRSSHGKVTPKQVLEDWADAHQLLAPVTTEQVLGQLTLTSSARGGDKATVTAQYSVTSEENPPSTYRLLYRLAAQGRSKCRLVALERQGSTSTLERAVAQARVAPDLSIPSKKKTLPYDHPAALALQGLVGAMQPLATLWRLGR